MCQICHVAQLPPRNHENVSGISRPSPRSAMYLPAKPRKKCAKYAKLPSSHQEITKTYLVFQGLPHAPRCTSPAQKKCARYAKLPSTHQKGTFLHHCWDRTDL